mgnify:FL=1
MKVLIKALFAIVGTALLISCFSANAREYKAGIDYEIKNSKLTAKPEIREFFSFFCPHCYLLEQTFSPLNKEFSPKADVVYNPVYQIGGELGKRTQSAYAVAKKLGRENELRHLLFKRIKQTKGHLQPADDFDYLFEVMGINGSSYHQELKSAEVKALINDYNQKIAEYELNSVPQIIVNGKYQIILSNVQDEKDYKDLVSYLLSKDHLK